MWEDSEIAYVYDIASDEENGVKKEDEDHSQKEIYGYEGDDGSDNDRRSTSYEEKRVYEWVGPGPCYDDEDQIQGSEEEQHLDEEEFNDEGTSDEESSDDQESKSDGQVSDRHAGDFEYGSGLENPMGTCSDVLTDSDDSDWGDYDERLLTDEEAAWILWPDLNFGFAENFGPYMSAEFAEGFRYCLGLELRYNEYEAHERAEQEALDNMSSLARHRWNRRHGGATSTGSGNEEDNIRSRPRTRPWDFDDPNDAQRIIERIRDEPDTFYQRWGPMGSETWLAAVRYVEEQHRVDSEREAQEAQERSDASDPVEWFEFEVWRAPRRGRR